MFNMDGSFRFFVDYRKLNASTRQNFFPLPYMEKFLDSLGDAAYFSRLDAKSGYWKVEIEGDDREKTFFLSQGGLYRFLRTTFCFRNAPSTLQKKIDARNTAIW